MIYVETVLVAAEHHPILNHEGIYWFAVEDVNVVNGVSTDVEARGRYWFGHLGAMNYPKGTILRVSACVTEPGDADHGTE